MRQDYPAADRAQASIADVVSRLVNTMLDARELIEAVMLDFGLEVGQGRSKPQLLRDLARYLVDQRMAGRLALLVIDEAQNLSLSALEEVRMLSNLETEKSKLIQIVLVGQPNLRDLLARPELEQLRQRVTVSYHLQSLDADETAAYINHRLRRAAIGAPLEFSRDVTDLIHLSSEGVPRKINVIADAILLFGYGEAPHLTSIDARGRQSWATGVIVPRATASTIMAGPDAVARLRHQPGGGGHHRRPRSAQARLASRRNSSPAKRVLWTYRLLRESAGPRRRPASRRRVLRGPPPSAPSVIFRIANPREAEPTPSWSATAAGHDRQRAALNTDTLAVLISPPPPRPESC